MRPRGGPARWAALAAAWLVGGASSEAVLPGDGRYHTQFMGIRPSIGALRPAFSPDVFDYELAVEEQDAEGVTLTFQMDPSRYDPDPKNLPVVTIEDKPLPPKGADCSYYVDLEDEIGPFDKVTRVKIADPAGGTGWGFWYNPRAHTYSIRITQPPDFARITSPRTIAVVGSDGTAFRSHPAFNVRHPAGLYEYRIGQKGRVKLTVKCSELATGFRVNGKTGDGRETSQEVDIRRDGASVLVECLYKGASSPEGKRGRTIVKLSHFVDLSELTMELSMDKRDGYCQQARATLGDPQPAKSFVCRSALTSARIMAKFNEPGAKVSLKSASGEETVLEQGTAKVVAIPEGTTKFVLYALGDKEPIQYDVQVIRAAPCSTLSCSSSSAAKWLCFGERCTRNDRAHCCGEPALCLLAKCPKDMHLRPDAGKVTCAGSMCDAMTDIGTCCTFAPPDDDGDSDGDNGDEEGGDEDGGDDVYHGPRANCSTAAGVCDFGFKLRRDPGSLKCSRATCGFLDAVTCCQECTRAYEPGCNTNKTSRFANCPDCMRTWNPDECCEAEAAKRAKAEQAEKLLEAEQRSQSERLSYFDSLGCFPEARPTCAERMCVYDESCLYATHSEGCGAAGNDRRCRFCGFSPYLPCPVEGSCYDGQCESWSEKKAKRCKEEHGMDCSKKEQSFGPQMQILWDARSAPQGLLASAARPAGVLGCLAALAAAAVSLRLRRPGSVRAAMIRCSEPEDAEGGLEEDARDRSLIDRL